MIIQKPLFLQKNNIYPWRTDKTYRFVKPSYSSPPKIIFEHLSIPQSITIPYYAKTGEKSKWNKEIPLALNNKSKNYDPLLLSGMRHAGKLAAECLRYSKTLVRPGVQSEKIDHQVREWAFSRNIYPSPLNYGGFAGSCCISINNIVAHGIPDK